MTRKPTMKQLVAATRFSRATIDRVLNHRPGVNPHTVEAVQNAYATLLQEAAGGVIRPPAAAANLRFSLLVQASREYNDSMLAAAQQLQEALAARGITLDVACCSDVADEEVVRLLEQQAATADGMAIVAKNTPPVNAAVQALKQQGKPLVALVSDLDPDTRHAFVGINNRAAGQAAGFIIGRHLQYQPRATVAVIVGTLSYSCHDDREIGFRAQIRKTLPGVNVLEVICGNDDAQQTYAATLNALKDEKNLSAVYNVAGGNAGLAAALDELKSSVRPLMITHEINEITQQLLAEEKIDYLLTQNMQGLVSSTVDTLCALVHQQPVASHTFLPIEIVTRFTLP